ncbi:MAG: hypothetical protein RR444_09920, partial [Oscillospiraceae bacterium]
MHAPKIYNFNLVNGIIPVIILLFHLNLHFGISFGVIEEFISQGAIFMTLFFMLLGFVLYYNYCKKDLLVPGALKSYTIKRFSKIYPPYFMLLIITIIFFNDVNQLQTLVMLPYQ